MPSLLFLAQDLNHSHRSTYSVHALSDCNTGELKADTQDETRQELWPGTCLHLGSWQRLEMKIRNQYPCSNDVLMRNTAINTAMTLYISAVGHTFVCPHAYVKCMLLMAMLLHIASVHRSKNILAKTISMWKNRWIFLNYGMHVCTYVCPYACECAHAHML